MANIVENVKELGLWEGGKETVKDIFGKGEHTVAAKFTVTDKNGEKKEVQNASAGPVYRTPSGGFTNTRSYAYLTNGDNGKLTLNVSRDLYDSDTFKSKFLENSTFKEVLKSYNANKNADTVIPVTKSDGTTENMKFSDLVNSYNSALKEFASAYENYSVIRDNVRNNTGFTLTDDEIRIAANTIDDDDKKSDTKIIYLPDDWLSIYDFSKLPSFDADTKSVSAKDFFDVYDLDKKNGINEDAWNQLTASANAIVSSAYSYADDSKEYNMKKNIEEDANGDEEVMAAAKDRLVRAMQASNLLAQHDPEISFLHSASIYASNTILSLGNSFVQQVNKAATFEAMAFDTYKYWADLGIAAIKDNYSQHIALMGAATEDLEDGTVTVENYNQYVDGILVSSTDGSQSEIDKVRAEFKAKLAAGDTLAQMSYSEGTPGYDLNKAVEWHQGYTAQIAPRAAKRGAITGQAIFLAIEVAMANMAGAAAGGAIYTEGAAAKTALSTIFKNGIPLGSRLKTFATFLARNKAVSWAGNLTVQALVDTFAFEKPETFLNAWAKLDPEAKSDIAQAFAENFAGNAVAEIIGVGGSAVGSKLLNSKLPPVRYVTSRAVKLANAISLPKKKAQLMFANTKIAKFLSRPLGKTARTTTDLAFKAMSNNPNAIFKASTLEEWNVEKFKMEYQATKNIAKAKKGVQYVTDLEKNTTKIAETTTEAIFGKLNEKTNFLVEAARIADGVKSYTREILADESIKTSWKGAIDSAENVQKILKWSEYNPSAGRFLSQDASNYVAHKTHYEDLLRKEGILSAAGKSLSAKEVEKLEGLRQWLKEFSERNGDPAVKALNAFIEKEQALNKALTDWQVRHGVMSKETYDSLAGTGIFGNEDELYVRTMAMPGGKSMDEINEIQDELMKNADTDFMEKTGYSSGTRDVNTIFEQDLHLSNRITDNYLDPIMVNSLTISSVAKAYQGKMWGNALNAIKAPVRELDVDGKPMTKKELKDTINQASNAAAESMSKMASDDLKELEGGGSIGTAYKETRLTNKKGVSKIELREQTVNNKLGIGTDKQIVTNTQKLTEEQTKNVMATFGEEAPIYGKVKTKAELEEVFSNLSEKQKAQALKAMGINPVETKKTVKIEKKNPEYAAWKKEKAKFEKQQASAKKKFEKAQANAASKSAKASAPKLTKEAKAQLNKEADDVIRSIFREDPKTWKPLSEEDVDKMFTAERQNELSDMLKDDFDMDKFRNLDSHSYKDVLDPEYIKKMQSADVPEEAALGPVVDLHDYRSEPVYDAFSGRKEREGYNKFLKEHATSTIDHSNPRERVGWIATEQVVSPATKATNNINGDIRNNNLDIGLDGSAPDIALKKYLDENIDVETIVGNYLDEPFDPVFGLQLDDDAYIEVANALGGKGIKSKKEAEKYIRGVAEEETIKMLKNGNTKLNDDTIMYRVVSAGGNKVNKGDLSWLDKKSGKFSDDGFMFVTFNEEEVLKNKNLKGTGDQYVLRIHAPKDTKFFSEQGEHYKVDEDGYLSRISYSGAGSGGELILTPGQKGKFVKSGEKIGDAEYVDVYLDGWNRPEAIKPFEEKAFDKPAPDEFIYETKTKIEKNKVKAIDEPGAMRAWNKAMSSEGLADDLNKTYISERVAPAEGGPKKMSEETRKTLTGYIAENTKASFAPEGVSIEGKTQDELVEEYVKRGAKEEAYNEAVKKLADARAMAKAVEAGTDPLTKNIQDVAETAIESGIGKLSRNPVAESLKKAAESYGIEDDTVYRYYTLSGMVEVNKEGETVLAKKFKDAFQDRLRTHMTKNPRAEGELKVTSMEAAIKESTEKLEEYVTSEWRKQQQFLSGLGANDIIDTNKMFDSINGELSKIVDDVTKNRNVIQILDESGNYKFVEVDPIVADLYRSRPYVIRGDDSFVRKMSRMARLGNTTFNLKSVMNQNYKDAIQSVIMAGLSHGIDTYAKEIADMFGDELVKYLQESMGEAGWNKFAEGLSESEAKIKAAKLLTEGDLGAKGFSGELTSAKLFQAGNAPEDYTKQVSSISSDAYAQMGYSKKKGMADKKNAKRGLLSWLEDHAPGNIVNNMRETYLRKANYAAAFNDAMKRGQTVDQARRTAEFVSRNATTNFRNTFMWGNYICDNVPFLSAAINGSASFWRLFEMDPIGVLTRINAAGFAMIAQVISSGQTYEDRETLRNIPDYIKRGNAVFIYDGTPFKIPLPEEVAVFLAPYRQAAEKMLGSENRSWVELLYNDALDISPIDLDGFSTEDQTALTKNEGLMSRLGRQIQVMISQCTPPIVQTIIMGVTGEDPYTGNPIDTSHVYYDENGIAQTMSYSTSESAKFLSYIANKFNWNLSASAAEKLIEKAMGTGGQQFLDGLVGLGEVMFGQSIDGEKVEAAKVLTAPLEDALKGAAGSTMVEDYQIKDQYDTDFKNIIRDLTAKKNRLLAPDSKYAGILSELGSLDSTADNYETKKTNLTRQALQEIEDFRNEAMRTVNTYVNHYGSDYDDKKFASVVALLNFDTPTVLPVTAKDFQDATNAYYRGRQDAYQTMIDLGFSSPSDFSILGIAKRNAQTGEVYTKYYSPVAILNAGNAVFSNMAEGVNAEIAAALEVAGIKRSDMFDGYYKAKAQGSAAAKQYKKDWNAKVVKAIAPTVYQYGADTVLENSVVQDYLDNYIFISNPYSTEKYLKEIFEVED